MQSWINHHPLLFVGAILLYIVLFWIFVVNAVALVSGWKLLAKHFYSQSPFLGPVWKWQRASIRGAGYNGCLTVGSDPMGLFLDIMAIFHVGHRPLFIPWTEIALRHQPWAPKEIVEIRLGKSEQVKFRIRGELASELQQAAGSSWMLDPNYPPEGPGRSGPETETSHQARFIVK